MMRIWLLMMVVSRKLKDRGVRDFECKYHKTKYVENDRNAHTFTLSMPMQVF